MKLPLITLPVLSLATTLTTQAGSIFSHDESKEVPYGIEALTQFRTEYNYRGFEIAQQTLEFQLGGEYALGDGLTLGSAAWYGAENGDGDFTELGVQAHLRKDVGQMSYQLTTTYRDFSNAILDSGLDLGASALWHFNDQFDFSATVSYDTGAEGWYSAIQSTYYHRINDASFITFDTGISFVDSYYTRNGLNDFFSKCIYTYNINQNVSISPYIGTSILLDNDDAEGDSLFGGVYFSVAF